jgi:hypothetical protein
MSHDELEKYRALYSEYVDQLVELHNEQQRFLSHTSKEAGVRLRATIKKTNLLNKKLWNSVIPVYKEYLKNLTEYRHQNADANRIPRKTGRPKTGEIRIPKNKPLGRAARGRPPNGEMRFDIDINNSKKS